jgi:hypothetical protein
MPHIAGRSGTQTAPHRAGSSAMLMLLLMLLLMPLLMLLSVMTSLSSRSLSMRCNAGDAVMLADHADDDVSALHPTFFGGAQFGIDRFMNSSNFGTVNAVVPCSVRCQSA